jgi:hypothetical protein
MSKLVYVSDKYGNCDFRIARSEVEQYEEDLNLMFPGTELSGYTDQTGLVCFEDETGDIVLEECECALTEECDDCKNSEPY